MSRPFGRVLVEIERNGKPYSFSYHFGNLAAYDHFCDYLRPKVLTGEVKVMDQFFGFSIYDLATRAIEDFERVTR